VVVASVIVLSPNHRFGLHVSPTVVMIVAVIIVVVRGRFVAALRPLLRPPAMIMASMGVFLGCFFARIVLLLMGGGLDKRPTGVAEPLAAIRRDNDL